MTFRFFVVGAASLALGACAAISPEPVISNPVAQTPSPEQQMLDQVAARAAPNQNVQSARLREDDNCYWYSYAGPVETTDLPLLTPEGRHICAPTPTPAPAPAPAAVLIDG